MSSYVPYKTKQFFFVLIKLSIVVGAFYFIYSKITTNESLEFTKFVSFLNENNVFSIKNISILIVLSFFNWFFEILKWQHLVGAIKHITFKSALEQSLGGLTASLITPNRIGDYGAKAIYYAKTFRTKIVLLNLLGNMAQMTVTTLFGIVGLSFFLNEFSIDINYYKVTRFASIILIIGLLVLFGVKQKRFKVKGVSFSTILTFIKSISLKIHSLNLSLSFLRYLIFSFQFYYLLIAFGVDINYENTMMVVTSMYLLASIVPTISIFDVVIKGSIAVFLFDYLQVSELIILSVTTTMWMLNFVIPSIIGSYFVLNFKLTNPIE